MHLEHLSFRRLLATAVGTFLMHMKKTNVDLLPIVQTFLSFDGEAAELGNSEKKCY